MNRLHEGFVLGGRYTLSTHIASGGMADVWAGRDQVLRRDVAVKVMRPDVEHEKLFSLRFRDEAVHSAGLLHANIATVFDYGEDDGLAYLVVELVDGQPLSAMLRERGPLPHAEARSIMGQAALALGVAHQARVVHRDVKPANIMIRRDGLVKLTDFGIARALDASGHTLHGELLGTPNYMSPEQVLGQAATGASDLYALGVVAHEMLSGQRPFDRETPYATAVALRLGLGDNEVMGLGLGLAWSADDRAPRGGSTTDASPNTIPIGLSGLARRQPRDGLELAE